jgi:hypothetical protein
VPPVKIPAIQWIVKLHPAHVVKANKESILGRPRELDVIEREVGSLPPHVKLIRHDYDLSTYSLFEIADYAVTGVAPWESKPPCMAFR